MWEALLRRSKSGLPSLARKRVIAALSACLSSRVSRGESGLAKADLGTGGEAMTIVRSAPSQVAGAKYCGVVIEVGVEQSIAVRQIAQEFSRGSSSGHSARLASLIGAERRDGPIMGAAGLSEGRRRVMSPSARRLLFSLLALRRTSYDVDRLRSSARRLERYLDDEDDDG